MPYAGHFFLCGTGAGGAMRSTVRAGDSTRGHRDKLDDGHDLAGLG
jgi:hypothetical protein